ncbi:MAG: hypothetical protein JNJ61_08550 [Anaerolineae bacterium]|nr:hypothetical protein [Anaerolineae bacterium]
MVTNPVPQALSTLSSSTHQLAIFPDHLEILFNDALNQLLHPKQIISLKDIAEVRLYSSRLSGDNIIQLVIFDHNHKRLIGLNYHTDQYGDVSAAKTLIEGQLNLPG